jgi:2-polyprenyl-6-hydroxyphenyl methylase/3-demethylubiquinone-9 3-methyltransferase
MPVDNELYNHLSHTWWDENTALGLLRTWLNPVRFGYFRRVLLEQYNVDPQGKTVLDVGCGGGLLSEEFARLGCHVTGIDPSEPSLHTARVHAQQAGLNIAYQIGVGECLPFASASFDIVVCCDTLEHVDTVEQVIREIARVLKPGGIFFYDTINRTFLTWLGAIKFAQDWTHLLPPNLHDWKRFVKPQELLNHMRKYHLQQQEIKGMSPQAHPFVILYLLFKQKYGKISLTEMGKHICFRESNDLSGSYMGYSIFDFSQPDL